MTRRARRVAVPILAACSLLAACEPGQRGSAAGTNAAPGAASPASAGRAQVDSSEALRTRVASSLNGKKIAWVPLALGLPLVEIWTRVMREEAEARGMTLDVRDPNMNTTAALQAVSALIAERPDVLVVHNPNVQLYAKELARAEAVGIVVVQVNMVSNQKTGLYAGVEWTQAGRLLGERIVKACGSGSASSGKVAIVQGEATSSVSLEETQGLLEVLKRDPSIRIVSNQVANWDATKAHDITVNVLQQHPDLCASVGYWGVMQMGAAQAVKSAGKQGQVQVFATGGDGKFDCDAVRDGQITAILAPNTPAQARAIIQFASFMLQSGLPADAVRMADYSRLQWITRDRLDPELCYDWARPAAPA